MTSPEPKAPGSGPEISVIVCTHNPRPDYFRRVITAIEGQTLDAARWELLIVDSGSTPPLQERFPGARGRVVREDLPGLTRARLRGIQEARGELIVFVDDDNVLESAFLERAAEIAQRDRHIGAWSGSTIPEFETTPPEWTRRYWGNLVIREVERDVWSNLPFLAETMPCGAGLCVRRDVGAHYAMLHSTGQRAVELDRVGRSLLSGGDNDLAMCACDVGLGVGLYSGLRLTHLIPSGRLEESYLLKLVEAIAFSTVLLRAFRGDRSWKQPPRLKTRVANLVRMRLLDARSRRFFRASVDGAEAGRQFLASGAGPEILAALQVDPTAGITSPRPGT